MELKGKTVLVTGAASGLGAACTKEFVKAGANVLMADLNEEGGKAVSSELGSKTYFVKTNVADEASATAAVNAAWEKFGSLHGLINCAGIGIPEKTVNKEGEPASIGNFSKVVTVNLIGSYNMARLVASSIVKKGSGSGEKGVIVNTASVAAYEGQIGQCSYSASKGGIVAMTLPLARELAQVGIRVNTIAPGIFDTPMLAGLPEKVRDALGQMVPFPPRLGKPEEYAQLAKHIFENEMLNGETIRLDGAIRLAPR